MNISHTPVMSKEVMACLSPREGETFVDCTLGLGGHAQEVLKAIGPRGKFVGIDRDGNALEKARERLETFKEQCLFAQKDYRHVNKVLEGFQIDKVDGILMDLGVSSYQLENPQRGFSFRADGPLDMRMDQSSRITAFDLINALSEKEIALILRDYGQERWYKRIARFIVTARSVRPIDSTKSLCELVLRAMPYYSKKEKIHPATRTFQAFRIAVNRELESLESALDKCIDALAPGGRIAVIAFHSLEDRIVKHVFRDLDKEKKIKLAFKKPLRPTEEEFENNPRARSARLRAAERI